PRHRRRGGGRARPVHRTILRHALRRYLTEGGRSTASGRSGLLGCPFSMARKEEPVAAQNVEGARYHKDVLTLEADHPWHRLRQLAPPGTEVLDVGCGSGDLGRFLADRASHVDGLEPNAERAEVARRYLRRVVTGVTGGPSDRELAPAYDVIVF